MQAYIFCLKSFYIFNFLRVQTRPNIRKKSAVVKSVSEEETIMLKYSTKQTAANSHKATTRPKQVAFHKASTTVRWENYR